MKNYKWKLNRQEQILFSVKTNFGLTILKYENTFQIQLIESVCRKNI